MSELALTASDARDFPDYRQVVARVLLELNERVKSLELELAVLVEGTLSDPDAQSIRTLAQRVEALERASAKNTGEGRAEGARSDDVAGPSTQPVQASPTGVREGVSAVDEGSAASRQAAPFPDPIPAWVPSVEEIQQFIDDGREGDLRALIASRAPAQPSVEEMAERLRVARNAWAGYAPGVVISPSDCWLALDRAAIGGGG